MNTIATGSSPAAVLLIDMQDRFLKDLSEKTREILIEEQINLIDDCSRMKVPIIVLEFKSFGKTIPKLASEIGKLKEVTVIEKDFNSGFEETNLDLVIKRLGVQRLVLTGINASFCVRSTAWAALSRGIEVITSYPLIADCDCNNCKPRNKSKDWYMSATTFFDQSMTLEEFLQ